MRVLGVDLGSRRIGLAVSDAEGSFAFPLDAIESRGLARDVEVLRVLIAEREVEQVVVGLPLHMSGRAGPEAESARRFATALGGSAGVPVDLLDERWTTAEAERALQTGPGGRGRRRAARKSGERDSMAASILLRTWLDRDASRAREAARQEDPA
jgi:putative Holliday junction resolvase